jgi:dolichol-phosphate mannosyltransferase
MIMEPRQVTVLIPSLEPDGKLVPYVLKLLERGFSRIVVVDDGSGPSYQPIFNELASLEGCRVLHHDKNLGKGDALKTGFAFIMKEYPGCPGVVTADSDGQHTVLDVWALAERLAKGEEGLLLGTRDFSMAHVPGRSRAGNRITSIIFWLLYGHWLKDTQTGLRAFSAQHLEFMMKVEGHRFEYEMNMLIACARENLPMKAVPIETVYENQNKGTHFHAFKDSLRIYRVIFKNFFRFMSSSFLATAIDLGISFLLLDALRAGPLANEWRIAIATGAARLVSSGFNFLVNKNFVFHSRTARHNQSDALLRYAILCVCVWAVSWGAVTTAHQYLGISDKLAKILTDTLLFFINYRVQQRWVFRKHPHHAGQGENSQ